MLLGGTGLASARGRVGSTPAGSASGTLTFGSNYSDEIPRTAMQAVLDGFPNDNVEVRVNTVDHNSYQENITNYLQQPDDVMAWFTGYRLQFFAAQGLVGDITDVWEGIDNIGDNFKATCTGEDGKQYMVPFYNYPWAVHYKPSLFEEHGFEIPTTLDELTALATEMQGAGLTPFSLGNDAAWPAMGTFDILNMRINGYQFHVDLMAGEGEWTSDEVREVFATWETLLPFHQSGPNGRTWQEAAQALNAGETGMMLLGTFISEQFADNLDDLAFFPFPEVNPEHGRDSIDAPIDGFMMAADPDNEEASKAMLAYLATGEAQITYLTLNPGSVAVASDADQSGYTDLQLASAELIAETPNIAQFLDRDTNPEFAANVMGDALADFLADPGSIDSILSDVEERKQVIFT